MRFQYGSGDGSRQGIGPNLPGGGDLRYAEGTSRHLVHFDTLKEDKGYAGVIETAPDRMASSHAVKRFFRSFQWGRIWPFRRLLRRLFPWRLRLEEPEVIVLGMDTMVLDNDEASARQGCQPTYKKVKGFQPLQATWGPLVVDALFRGGKKSGNAGKTAGNLVRDIVAFIRRHYRPDVPIIVAVDSGFFDQKLFRRFEELGIGYVATGRLYEDEQRLLEFARPDTVIYTNLGQGGPIDALLEAAGHGHRTRPQQIIELHHQRGHDELVHRALKVTSAVWDRLCIEELWAHSGDPPRLALT